MVTQEEIARVKPDIEALVDEYDSKLDQHERAYLPLDIVYRLLRYVAICVGFFGLPAIALMVLPEQFAWPGLFESDNPVDYVPFIVGAVLGCLLGAWLADPVNGPRASSNRVRGRNTLRAEVRQQFIDRYVRDTSERKIAISVVHQEISPEQGSTVSLALHELRWLTEDEWKKMQSEQLVQG